MEQQETADALGINRSTLFKKDETLRPLRRGGTIRAYVVDTGHKTTDSRPKSRILKAVFFYFSSLAISYFRAAVSKFAKPTQFLPDLARKLVWRLYRVNASGPA